jgi:hypothetical protein
MERGRFERLAPLAGLGFFVLFAIGRTIIGIAGSYPDANASADDAVSYWSDHSNAQTAVAVLDSFATLFFVWFAASVTGALEVDGAAGRRLARLCFGGALLAGAAILVESTLVLTTADVAGDVPDQVTQTLSALQADFFLPFAGGFALFQLAAGLLALRSTVLPRWLAWVSIASGVLWLTPISGLWLGFPWILIVSVMLFIRDGGEGAEVPRGAPA